MNFPYKIKVGRCVGSCNNLINPYPKVCIPDIAKDISVNVFDLISQQNELRQVRFHESCKCNCLLNERVCNDKQRWNENECKFECLKMEMLNQEIEIFCLIEAVLNKTLKSL